jgi:hypothetical protein
MIYALATFRKGNRKEKSKVYGGIHRESEREREYKKTKVKKEKKYNMYLKLHLPLY